MIRSICVAHVCIFLIMMGLTMIKIFQANGSSTTGNGTARVSPAGDNVVRPRIVTIIRNGVKPRKVRHLFIYLHATMCHFTTTDYELKDNKRLSSTYIFATPKITYIYSESGTEYLLLGKSI